MNKNHTSLLVCINPRRSGLIFGLMLLGLHAGNVFAAGDKPIVALRFDTGFLQVTNSNGDEWAPTWADDGNLYTGNDDGSNFGGIAGRSVAFGKLVGEDPLTLAGTTLSDLAGYGEMAAGPDQANWKTMNSYCVDGVLYMLVTRCMYPEQAKDPHKRHIFKNATIIKSLDKGKTWTPAADAGYAHPMFPGLRFGAPYFVWYGQDGQGTADGAKAFVYAVSNNGHFEDGDDYVLGRVLRRKLPELNGADWEFYTGGDGMLAKNWSGDMTKAKGVLADPLNCSMTGMTYIPGLRRYVMVVWHYKTYDLRTDPRTINDYYEAPHPWGPWTRFFTTDTDKLGWYVPIIAQKFQKQQDKNTVRCILYLTGNYQNPAMYKLNFIPITLSTVPLPSAPHNGGD